ncbi:MAG: hypothetical protein ACU85E_07045 [Gammaproteobacteria bacterium]
MQQSTWMERKARHSRLSPEIGQMELSSYPEIPINALVSVRDE